MAAGDIQLYDAVLSSNLPREEKSALRRWFEKSVGESLTTLKPRGQVKSTLSAFRQSSETLLTGAILGAINVESKTGLDVMGVPVDGAAGLLLTAGSALAGTSELSADARNIGSTCLGIYAFRQTTDLLAEKRLARGKALPAHLLRTGTKVSGESTVAGEDPIIQAAKAAKIV